MNMGKMKRKKSVSYAQQIAVVCVVLLLVLISLAAAVVFLYKPASDNSGDLPFSTNPPDTQDTVPDDSRDSQDSQDANDTKSPDSSADTSSGNAYVQREEVYNFLLIGHDRAATLADVIMLVNYNVPDGVVSIMQLPRDTYYEGEAVVSQLNVEFSTYYNRARMNGDSNPASTAAKQFASVLERNLCIKIHYTAVLNLDGFVDIVDALGGVTIDVPYDMDYDDPDQDLSIHLKAGVHTLNGEQAEGFVRFRDNYVQADIGRVNAQKLFMAAFIDTLKSSVSLSNITQLVTSVLNHLTTDLSVADAVYFMKNALSIDNSKITMMTVPCDYSGGLVINRAATLQTINRYFNIYNTEISDAIFDPERRFVNENNSSMVAAYYAESAAIDDRYTAEDIQHNSIDIPLKEEP